MLPGPTVLLTEAWRVYKKNFTTFIGIVGISALLSFLLAILSVQEGFFSFLFQFVNIGIYLWSTAALLVAVKEHETPIGIREAYRRGWRYVPALFWVTLLSILIPLGGFLFFFVPGIIFLIWFLFAFYVVIEENVRGRDALLKSREYVRGRWWQVVGRLFFIFIPTLLISWAELKFFQPSSVSVMQTTIYHAISSAISIVIMPLTTLYFYFLYRQLRALRGDFIFIPTRKARIMLLIPATLGIFVPAAFILLISSYLFLFRPFQVTGNSMAPNYLHGQYYFVDVKAHTKQALQRGDTIIFRIPTNPNRDSIKRIIGLPDDSVFLENGSIYLNGEQLDETNYVAQADSTFGSDFLREGQSQEVPADHYFVLGDNRPESSDSRTYGFVPKDNIVGKVTFCYRKCSSGKSVKH